MGISGSCFHLVLPVLASSANTYLGPVELVTYIVSPTTSGVDSCDSRAPSECIQATRRFFTLPVLIWFSALYRVLLWSPP